MIRMDTAMDGKVVLDTRKLKTRRKQLGYSQEALSYECEKRRLKVSLATIKRAETGKPVTYRTARDLAEFFSLQPTELMVPQGEACVSGRYSPPVWHEVERGVSLPSYALPHQLHPTQPGAPGCIQAPGSAGGYLAPKPQGDHGRTLVMTTGTGRQSLA